MAKWDEKKLAALIKELTDDRKSVNIDYEDEDEDKEPENDRAVQNQRETDV